MGRATGGVKGEGQKGSWTKVGAFFAHQDGGGGTLLLEAPPLDGRIVLPPEIGGVDMRREQLLTKGRQQQPLWRMSAGSSTRHIERFDLAAE